MSVRYLVFDIESVADPNLVVDVRYPRENLTPAEAVARYRAELMEKNDSDFIPYTYQLPVAVAVAKVAENFSLLDLVLLDDPLFRPHEITAKFWSGWTFYKQPTLVSFNGRGFDLPLLELAAFRFGIPIPAWFSTREKTFDQPRNRYNLRSHIDLYDFLTNNGASRFHGGLNLAAHLIGKPGKMDTRGDMVQDMYDQGEIAKINDYCRCDVLDTYFIFLRSLVLNGSLSLEDEQRLVRQTRQWIEERRENEAYRLYLENWGDWVNPWETPNAER